MIFAKYDVKSIFKDIQRMELGETVKINITKILYFFFFSKKISFLSVFYNFCGTDVKQTYCWIYGGIEKLLTLKPEN